MHVVIMLATAAIALPNAEAAFAQQTSVAGAAVAAQAQPKTAKPDQKEKLICETDQVLGSLLPRRLCMTRSQWDRVREGAQRAIRDQAQDVEPRTQSGGH